MSDSAALPPDCQVFLMYVSMFFSSHSDVAVPPAGVEDSYA
jgi:hypothetical protein